MLASINVFTFLHRQSKVIVLKLGGRI